MTNVRPLFAILLVALLGAPVACGAAGPAPTTVPAAAPAGGQPSTEPTTAPALSPASTAAPAPAVTSASSGAQDDFGSPGLMLFVLALLLLCLVAVILAVAVGLVLLAAGAVLVLLGIVSSSVLVGLVSRTRRAAVRAFVIQAAAVAGAPLGVGMMWLECRLLHLPLSHRAVLLIGGPGGLLAGAGLGLLFCMAAERVARFLTIRLRGGRSAPAFPAIRGSEQLQGSVLTPSPLPVVPERAG